MLWTTPTARPLTRNFGPTPNWLPRPLSPGGRPPPEIADATLPGVCLRGARAREGMTQKQLSEKTGVPMRHLSEMENGKRPIGKAMAKRLGEALGVGYKVFL